MQKACYLAFNIQAHIAHACMRATQMHTHVHHTQTCTNTHAHTHVQIVTSSCFPISSYILSTYRGPRMLETTWNWICRTPTTVHTNWTTIFLTGVGPSCRKKNTYKLHNCIGTPRAHNNTRAKTKSMLSLKQHIDTRIHACNTNAHTCTHMHITQTYTNATIHNTHAD